MVAQVMPGQHAGNEMQGPPHVLPRRTGGLAAVTRPVKVMSLPPSVWRTAMAATSSMLHIPTGPTNGAKAAATATSSTAVTNNTPPLAPHGQAMVMVPTNGAKAMATSMPISTAVTNNTPPLTCQWEGCHRQEPQTFPSKEALTKHVHDAHVSPFPAKPDHDHAIYCRWHACPRTGKPFSTRTGLVNHMRNHTGTRHAQLHCPYNGCRKWFTSKEGLSLHQRQKHTAGLPLTPIAVQGHGPARGGTTVPVDTTPWTDGRGERVWAATSARAHRRPVGAPSMPTGTPPLYPWSPTAPFARPSGAIRAAPGSTVSRRPTPPPPLTGKRSARTAKLQNVSRQKRMGSAKRERWLWSDYCQSRVPLWDLDDEEDEEDDDEEADHHMEDNHMHDNPMEDGGEQVDALDGAGSGAQGTTPLANPGAPTAPTPSAHHHHHQANKNDTGDHDHGDQDGHQKGGPGPSPPADDAPPVTPTLAALEALRVAFDAAERHHLLAQTHRHHALTQRLACQNGVLREVVADTARRATAGGEGEALAMATTTGTATTT